jgi:hypothetical protein
MIQNVLVAIAKINNNQNNIFMTYIVPHLFQELFRKSNFAN